MDIGQIFNQAVVVPMTVALEWLNGLLGTTLGLSTPWLSSWGLTIILFTVIIKLVTLPLTLQQLRSSKKMQELQPQIQALQKQYGKDREKLSQAQMQLYKENNVNPMAGCLPMLIQMPIWIGLYQALFGLASSLAESRFLWIPSLAATEISSPSAIVSWPPEIPVLALLCGLTQWVTQKMMTPTSTDPQQQMMQSMMQFMPLMFVFFSFSVPSGLVLYWVASNLFMVVQQYFTSGWGSLRPATATASATSTARAPVAVSDRRAGAKLPPGKQTGLSAPPEANGHSSETSAVQRAIPQAPPGARKRRRRNK